MNYADNRSLKKYYSNGDIHTAKELLDAGIEAWILYEEGSKGDIETKAWLKRKGLIVNEASQSIKSLQPMQIQSKKAATK